MGLTKKIGYCKNYITTSCNSYTYKECLEYKTKKAPTPVTLYFDDVILVLQQTKRFLTKLDQTKYLLNYIYNITTNKANIAGNKKAI